MLRVRRPLGERLCLLLLLSLLAATAASATIVTRLSSLEWIMGEPFPEGLYVPPTVTADISADGRYVAYTGSWMMPRVIAGPGTLYVYDRTTGQITRVPALPGYTLDWAPALSGEGRWLACLLGDDYMTTTGNLALYDRQYAVWHSVTASASDPAISDDGRYLAFLTDESLSPTDPGGTDLYLYDAVTHAFTWVSRSLTEAGYMLNAYDRPAISGNGRLIAFGAANETTAKVLVYDRVTAGMADLSLGSAFPAGSELEPGRLALSADGQWLAVNVSVPDPASTTGLDQGLYAYNLATHAFDRVDLDEAGEPLISGGMAPPALSADGRYVAFTDDSPSVPGVWIRALLRDRQLGTTENLLIMPTGEPIDSLFAIDSLSLSADGRWLAFSGSRGTGDMVVSFETYLAVTSVGAPEVIEVSPPGGATDASPGVVVTAKFSEPLAPASVVPGSVTLNGAVTGAVAGAVGLHPAGQVVAFTPTHALAADTYTATIAGGSTGVKDATGVPLAANYTWTFTVPSGPLQVTHTEPAADDAGVPVSALVRVAFSLPVNPATLAGHITVTGATAGAIAGAVTYDAATYTATFTPAAPLPLDSYTATVKGGPSGVLPVSGLPLAADCIWHFTVPETVPPTVVITAPANGATVKGSFTVRATANDNVAVAVVVITVSDWPLTLTMPPYETQFPSVSLLPDGPCTITAVAYDTAGNASTPASIAVTVDNTTFEDVPRTHPYWAYIEAIVRERITSGCSQTPRLYCPDAAVTRGQMAVFICRAAGWSPYNKPTPTFADVRPGSGIYGYVEEIYRRGITGGCGGRPLRFCPDTAITRGQLAVFLCRAAGLTPLNPATPTYSDVPATNPQYRYIEAIAAAEIMDTCGSSPLRFCPGSVVKRGPMAQHLCRAFQIAI